MRLFPSFIMTFKNLTLAKWRKKRKHSLFFFLFFSLIDDITIKKTHTYTHFFSKIYNRFDNKCVCMFTLIRSREKKALNINRKQNIIQTQREREVVGYIYIYKFICASSITIINKTFNMESCPLTTTAN
jgi:hypothetical protein